MIALNPFQVKLKDIIISHASELNISANLNPVKLLATIAMKESKFGLIRRPRYERNYGPNTNSNSTYNKSIELQANFRLWGAWAAESYGSFQIMSQTAFELGFSKNGLMDNPSQLWLPDDSLGIKYVLKLLNNRILKPPYSLSQIADAYNSGTFIDKYVPEDYVEDFCSIYNNFNIF